MSTDDDEGLRAADPGKPTLGEIPADECLALLATKRVGRLVVVVADEPDVFPVNYLVDGTNIVFRTAYGKKLTQSVLQRVAFEVDHIDEERREGWSVVLRGVGEEITEDLADRTAQGRNEILVAWASGAKDRWVRVIPRIITGRRLTRY